MNNKIILQLAKHQELKQNELNKQINRTLN